MKKIKPAKKKHPLKKGVLLKKKLTDIMQDINFLKVSKKKLTENRLKKMLAKHFSEHPKLQLGDRNLLTLWAHLSVFAQDTKVVLVPYITGEEWTKDQLILLVRRVELAEKLMVAILEVTNADSDTEEQ